MTNKKYIEEVKRLDYLYSGDFDKWCETDYWEQRLALAEKHIAFLVAKTKNKEKLSRLELVLLPHRKKKWLQWHIDLLIEINRYRNLYDDAVVDIEAADYKAAQLFEQIDMFKTMTLDEFALWQHQQKFGGEK